MVQAEQGAATPTITTRDPSCTGPGTPAGRYLRSFWHPVHLAKDLLVGRAKRLEIMSEEYTLYRGEDGMPHVIAPHCAHRGTVLWTGWVEGGCVRCFYHGWKYDGSGHCVEAPAEREGFSTTVSIRSYPTEEYLGLIFAYLGEGAPPLRPRFLHPYEDEGLVVNSSYVRDCNYMNNLESNMDELHAAFVHRNSAFTREGLNRALPEVTGEETEYGLVKYGKRPDGVVRVSPFYWPNALRISSSPQPGDPNHVWADHIAWRVPLDDTRHASFNVDWLPLTGEAAQRYLEKEAQIQETLRGLPSAKEVALAVLRGEMHTDDVANRPDVVNIQDYVAQVGQGVIADYEHERLGRSDVLVSLYRHIWQRELTAWMEGRPTKQWTSPDDVLPTPGI